jgi:hypothetical protein
MRKDLRPDTSKLDSRINPFTYSLEIKLKRFENTAAFERDDEIILHQFYTRESTPKVSLYVKPEHRLIQNSLLSCAKELLLWLLYVLETNKDYIWINRMRYMSETSTSLNTYKKAVDNLERYGFIDKAPVKDTYWINPEFFFKGDRRKKYPTKCVIESTTTAMPTKELEEIIKQ